jgi:hypothetical protein
MVGSSNCRRHRWRRTFAAAVLVPAIIPAVRAPSRAHERDDARSGHPSGWWWWEDGCEQPEPPDPPEDERALDVCDDPDECPGLLAPELVFSESACPKGGADEQCINIVNAFRSFDAANTANS